MIYPERALLLDGWSTAADGHFTLASISVDFPAVRESRQDIPGMDGDVDLTEAVAGYPTYKTRKLTAQLETSFGNRRNRIAMTDELCERVHGKTVDIVHPDYPDTFFRGRATITKVVHNAAYTTVDLTATCDPHQYSAEEIFNSFEAQSVYVGVDNVNLTAVRGGTVDKRAFTINLVASCAVGDYAIYSAKLQPETEYYVAMLRWGGRGKWRLSNHYDIINPDDFEESCICTTGSDGLLYIRLDKLSADALKYGRVRIIPTAQVYRASTGVAPVSATVGAAGTAWVSTNGTYYDIGKGHTQIPLAAGNPVVWPIAVGDKPTVSVSLRYRRRAW